MQTNHHCIGTALIDYAKLFRDNTEDTAGALAAIQAAVAAALAPLQTKVNAMSLELQEIAKGDAEIFGDSGSETEEEDDDNPEAEPKEMLVDSRHKRTLENEAGNTIRLRKPRKSDSRPARAPRKSA